MKRNLKPWIIGSVVALFIAGAILFVFAMFFPNSNILGIPGLVAEVKDKPTPEQKAILNANFEGPDDLTEDDLSSRLAIADTIHMMANSKIIAVDGQIWGIKKITKSAIEKVRAAMDKQGLVDSVLQDTLARWEKQDYSQAVEEHNYVWKNYLNGNVGRAIRLRPEAKQK